MSDPSGKIIVVDSSPLNWLYITYNTVEELVRVDTEGNNEPAAMSDFRWLDGTTLEADIRQNNVFPDENPLSPYPHDDERSSELWSTACQEAGIEVGRPLRIASFAENESIARFAAGNIESAFGVKVEVIVYGVDAELKVRRRLAEKKLPHEWDVLIIGHGAQSADGVALEVHRAFAGDSGELRAGPALPEFESLYRRLVGRTDPEEQVEVTGEIDQYVYDEALALFLISPKSLYAVNRHVDFTPHATTFEFAQTTVDDSHWSRTS